MLVIVLTIVSIIAIMFIILYFTYSSGCDNAVKEKNKQITSLKLKNKQLTNDNTYLKTKI
jgi:hypothetical protein